MLIFKSYQKMFLMFLVTGTVMAVTSNSWFLCWLGLELNLMSLIPLILSKLEFESTESAIKYFLVQALASIIIIFIASMDSNFLNFNSFFNLNIFIFLALTIKAGLAPFHFWFPQIMMYMNWTLCILILTWQKIAPFILMSYFFSLPLSYFIITSSAIIGALGGLNQTLFKLLITYSSITHSGWMLLASSVSLMSWMNYFFIYSVITLSIIKPIQQTNIETVNQMNLNKMPSMFKISLIFSFMSLGGLPPFLGFAAKISVLVNSINSTSMMILFTLIVSSLISLLYYTKMFYNNSMNLNLENKIIMKFNFMNLNLFLVMSLFMNLILPLMTLFF